MLPPASLWWSQLTSPVTTRRALDTHIDVDVCIVGGGYTGLWTARELKRRDQTLRIAVVEKTVCGFGASGRNGGWVSALFPVSNDQISRNYGADSLTHQQTVLQQSVKDIGASLASDNILANFRQGGTLTFARSEVQAKRLQEEVLTSTSSASDFVWLTKEQANERGRVRGSLGASYSPHCARVHPAKLVRGLSDVCEALGVQIYEDSTVTRIIPRHRGHQPEVITPQGSIHAEFVVRATEGFTSTLAGQRRTVAPIYSLMIASEPQSDEFWNEVGFSKYETFADDRHLIIYGQRTEDNRIAFGGRGSPYHFGSTIEERFDSNKKVFTALGKTLRELFPSLEGEITHQWGGPLGMPRDLMPSVHVDYESGIASAGGYTGDGVTLSYVAANALADLITKPDVTTEFTRLPFVQRKSKNWELEPFRWVGVNAGLALAKRADHIENRKGFTSKASSLLDRLIG